MKIRILVQAAGMLLATSSAMAQQATGMDMLLLPPANTTAPASPQGTGTLTPQTMQAPAAPALVPSQQVQPGMQPMLPPEQVGQAYPDPYGQPPQDPNADFNRAMQETFPMSPDQIREYRQLQEQTNRAMVQPVAPGRPVSRSLRLSLRPGEVTPVLRVQPGVVSTLTFSDGTGQPWPVMSVVTGNPQAYVAQSAGPEGKSNIIVMSTIQPWMPSNVVVTLMGYPVPITMMLQQGSPETDYRVDVQLSSRGPNALAESPGAVSLAATDDSTMMSFGDGVAPPDSRKLRTNSPDVDVWMHGDLMYVRTPGEIVSPRYVGRSSNVSGVNVFSLPDSPVLLVSRGGQLTSIKITP
jgi:intracellular multiplication protein IcmK